MSKERIAFFLPSLSGGGAEKVSVNLLKAMVKHDLTLDLVLGTKQGPYLAQVPAAVNIIDLGVERVFKAVIPLAYYLQKYQPHSLLSHLGHANIMAILATKIVGSKTKLVLVEHNTLSASNSQLWRAKLVPWFMEKLYPSADSIVGVSQGVSQDLETELGLKPGLVKTIYNPAIDRELIAKSKEKVNHPWLQSSNIPVFLAVGRLTAQKDFSTLIQAFALVRKKRSAKLIILGKGELQAELQQLANSLGLEKDIELPGFVANPYAYMSKATAFVLSSRWEGLPTVLIEAMACGCPVISTDCPSGPREILADGLYGSLVPVNNVTKLSEAMLEILEFSINRNTLQQRAAYFSPEQVISQYLKLLVS